MIKFLTGRQTDPLQEKILEQAVQNYTQNPEEETFIIVPNHIKFTTEVRAINKLAINEEKETASVKNLQVLSFSRLAWYFLKEAEDGLLTQLDDAAAAMLLSQIITEKKEELLLFQNININSGLVKQIYDTVLQIHDGNIDLDDLSNNENTNVETQNKIHDLRIIYNTFINRITGKFSTKNEVQLQLNELLATKDNLKNASFYFTDFSHFSLQEILTIKLLMNKAKNVTFAFKTKIGQINPNPEVGDYDYVIQTTIRRLVDFCQKHNLTYITENYQSNGEAFPKEVLNGIWTQTIPNTPELKQVQLVKADSRYAEAYFVARTIYQQVALSNYRYRDFLILAPNLHEYETYLSPILRQNKIPFFNDLQQEMKYHPLVVLIENLAALLKRPFQTQNMLTLLKTKLLIPNWYKDEASYQQNVDELENFVLAHGINHTLWKKNLSDFLEADVIGLDKNKEEVARLDRLRQYLVEQVDTLFVSLEKEKDPQKAITIFFNFLVDNGVAKRLDEWRKQADDNGDLQQAQQPEQLWNLLIQLLKDYLLIQDSDFELSNFFEMLISGFREATFSQIPSTLDAVNISEIGMVQSSNYKQVFIIGATSGNLPKIQKTPGFLSSENIQDLTTSFSDEAYIEDYQKLNNLDQNYQFGLAMSLADVRVYISYPILNASNEQLEPSIFYTQLQNAGAKEYRQFDLPENLEQLLSFITSPEASLGYLAYLDAIDSGKQIKELLTIAKEYIPEKTQDIIKASQFDNNPEDIGPELAEKLYGKNLNLSVSQLETLYQNSFEYFLKYGLRLKKRFENELDISQAGNYFHETFDRLVKEMNRRKLDLTEIDNLELEKLLQTARQAMREEGRYSQLMNDPFNRYLFKCLDRTTSKVAEHWHRKVQETPLKAKYSELSFGLGEKVKGIQLEIPNLDGNHNITLRGKIDRLDLAKIADQNQILAQVIDYKSSEKKFDLGMFYNGASMQMISYLDVINQNSDFFTDNEELALFGAFYQTITHQTERLNSKTSFDSKLNLKENQLDSKPKLMYNGLISNDPDLIKEAEPSLKNSSTASKIYSGVRSKANGGFTLPKERNFTEDEIQLLLDYDEYLIKKASWEILSGKVKLNPYRYGKNRSALTYSDYRDVFFFDAMLNQNQYHDIKNMTKKELIENIKKTLGKRG